MVLPPDLGTINPKPFSSFQFVIVPFCGFIFFMVNGYSQPTAPMKLQIKSPGFLAVG
jgi:hypothetical protein